MRSHIVLCVALCVAACSDPKSEIIPPDGPGEWSQEFAQTVKKLPEDDRKLLAGYLMRNALKDSKDLALPTIGEAIDDQKKFLAAQAKREAEEKALADKARRERDAQIAKLRSAVTVALTSKVTLPEDSYSGRYSPRIKLTITIHNKTTKAVTGVKGLAVFRDQFGETIMETSLAMDERIAPGATRTTTSYGMDVNEFMDDHVKLAVTKYADLKFEFVPEQIVFDDRSVLSAPTE